MAIKGGWQGRFYDDFSVGDVYRSHTGRTVTQTDNIWISLLTNNTNQLHFNEHYASRTPFGRPLVNSAITLAIVAGLSVSDTSENGFALGWDKITLPNPLYEGETLYSESEVLDKRESASRPGMGIVRFRTRGLTQAGIVVMDYTRSVMVWRRAAAPVMETFPEPELNAEGTAGVD